MHLRCELRGHEEDVRSLCVTPVGVVSSSRDKSVRIWTEASDNEFKMDKMMVGHSDYVTAVSWMPAGLLEGHPQGAIVSGSRDKSLIVWDHDNCNSGQTYKDCHEYQITSLGVTQDGAIVSASIDGKIKLWKDGKNVGTMDGHNGPVLCVLVLPDGQLLSGSGDKTIKLWKGLECVKSFEGHSDTVRDLALLEGVGVVSASHDHTLRVWTFQAECLAELVGHAAIIYSCSTSKTGHIASASEDNTARVWKPDGTCLHVLDHPGCVWSVAFLDNGDLVTGCSDALGRVWSESNDRKAPAEILEAHKKAVSDKQQELMSGQKSALPPGLKMENPEVLQTPGDRDGQTKVVSEDGGAVVYMWSATKFEWEKVGNVMGNEAGEMTAGSKVHNGQHWDYVFDVDVEDGAPPKKLCMNRGDDPYYVAEMFLLEEGLPASYKSQIVDFIIKNTEQAPMQNVDPFTGGGSYVPAGAGPSSGPGGNLFGGMGVTGGGVDPYTGARQKSLKYSPKSSCAFFDVVRAVDPIASKIRDFNSQLLSEPGTSSLALEENEATGGLESLLGAAVKSAQGDPAGLSDVNFVLLFKLLNFPQKFIFPSMDICRLAVLHPECQKQILPAAGDLASQTPGAFGRCILHSDSNSGIPANQQVCLQLLCNCFRHPPLRNWVKSQQSIILERLQECCKAKSKNIRLALATLILNFAVEEHVSGVDNKVAREALMNGVLQILTTVPQDDFESVFRAIVAAGTLMYDNSHMKEFGKFQGILDWGAKRKEIPGSPQKLIDAVDDLDILLNK